MNTHRDRSVVRSLGTGAEALSDEVFIIHTPTFYQLTVVTENTSLKISFYSGYKTANSIKVTKNKLANTLQPISLRSPLCLSIKARDKTAPIWIEKCKNHPFDKKINYPFESAFEGIVI